MSVPRGGDVPPIEEEAARRVVGMLPGSTLGRSGQVRPVAEDPRAATRRPDPGGGGVLGTVEYYIAGDVSLASGAEEIDFLNNHFGIPTDDDMAPYVEYQSGDIVILQPGWYEVMAWATFSGMAAGDYASIEVKGFGDADVLVYDHTYVPVGVTPGVGTNRVQATSGPFYAWSTNLPSLETVIHCGPGAGISATTCALTIARLSGVPVVGG